ncbi:hypothetical protein DBR11_23780 [Pedobacter sp. HMWF019]|uniref:hypothetical protein n=1 Tax=Pedobacter sp. HMWF019 TaxID=2056856 RepID=UPI000D3B5EAB|nr:hypothetical protein [Pedobacter sp. HMWF019]PTS94256.1 hypothetical protein DBR11_23780 [Pedobacter sp. HMWF019]
MQRKLKKEETEPEQLQTEGQEKHLPNEGWHVVQQKEDRVKATKQMKDGVGANDDAGLEKEADVMGRVARG